MKEKVLFIAGSILILLVIVIFISNNQETDPRAEKISNILKAGLDLKSDQFCSGLTQREQKRITKETNRGLKDVGLKPANDCFSAINQVANYQAQAQIQPKTLAVSTLILKERRNQIIFATSSCSVEDNQTGVAISPNPLVGRAIVVDGEILIDSVNVKEKITKENKAELEENLFKINSSCV